MNIKMVKKATPEYATSETLVWWDMDNCPLPNGYDPRRLAPKIDTELKNLGYSGPLTIVAGGNLYGISYDFLRALSSTGVVIRNSTRDVADMVRYYLDSRTSHSPMSIMLITTNSGLLYSILCKIYKGILVGCNLLLAYPPSCDFEDPHPSSFATFGGEWLWSQHSLLKVSGVEETRGLVNSTGFEMFSCETCVVDSFASFEDFIEHLETSKLHEALVEFDDDTVEMMIKDDTKKLESRKQSEHYRNLLEAKKKGL